MTAVPGEPAGGLGRPSVERTGSPSPRRLTVFFAAYSPASAVCHYRMSVPAAALAAAGHHAAVGDGVLSLPNGEVIGVAADGAGAGRRLVGDIDVLVIQPGPGRDVTDLIWGARRAGQVVVVDVDDWWWDLPEQFPKGPGVEEGIRGWLPTLRAMLGACDMVTVSTAFLAEELRGWPEGLEVALLPNAVDPTLWGDPEDVGDGPVLGYAGSLSGHVGDVAVLRGWLPELMERHDLRMIHVGWHPDLPDIVDVVGLDPDRVEIRRGLPFDDYVRSRPFRGMDIGLVPLQPRPYNRAKSALKGMEYAACGVPFVASPSPEYQRLGGGVLAGGSFEVQSDDGWVAAVERLLDAAERVRVAHEQCVRLAAEDVRVRGGQWEELYLSLAR